MQTKATTRQQIRQQRQQLNAAEAHSAATAICQHITTHTSFSSSKHIAIYYTYAGEVDTSLIARAIWRADKQCYLPVLDDNQQLHFVCYEQDTPLVSNRYNILEPTPSATNGRSPQALDLIFLPLVAFDLHGNRLGMGAGYYDRTFAFLAQQTRPARPKLVGLAYEFQHIERLSSDDWDIPLDAIVTEKQWYKVTI